MPEMQTIQRNTGGYRDEPAGGQGGYGQNNGSYASVGQGSQCEFPFPRGFLSLVRKRIDFLPQVLIHVDG